MEAGAAGSRPAPDVPVETPPLEGWRDPLPETPPRRRAALRERIAALDEAAIYEEAPAALLTLDWQGCVLRANRAATAMLGSLPFSAVGWPLATLLDPRHLRRFLALLRQARSGGFPRAALRVRAGDEDWRGIVATARRIDAGGPIPLIGVALSDAADPLDADPQEVGPEAFALSLAAAWQDAVIVTDHAGTIRTVNAAAESLLGRSAEDLRGRSCGLLPVTRLPPRKAWNALRKGGEHLLRHGGGWMIPVEVRACPVPTVPPGRALLLRDLSERRRFDRDVLSLGERERRRIGQDLHDGLIQVLAGVSFMARQLEQRLRGQDLPESQEADRIAGLLQGLIEDARNVSHQLYPVELEHNGLAWALQRLGETVGSMYGIRCSLRWRLGEDNLDTEATTHLYRVAQEAMSNAARHGHARSIKVQVLPSAHGGTLIVEDDGVGFETSGSTATGMGLDNMRRRAECLGGSLRIGRRRGGGARVTCTFRLPRDGEG